jgi:hypothetical protein
METAIGHGVGVSGNQNEKEAGEGGRCHRLWACIVAFGDALSQ